MADLKNFSQTIIKKAPLKKGGAFYDSDSDEESEQ